MEAAESILAGFQQSHLKASYQLFPIADGGDYTLEVLLRHFHGELVQATSHDPLNRPINASYGLVNQGKIAIIEFAKASGLHLLQPSELNPMITSSFGTGELIKDALNHQVEEIWLTVGGSATVEAGIGILQALGVKLLKSNGELIPFGAQGLKYLQHIDLTEVDHRIANTHFKILCDVDNYLLGTDGAAKVFGPQKGADQQMVEDLDGLLTHFAKLTYDVTHKDIANIKGGGAAGGVPATLSAYLPKVEMVAGIDFILDAMDFNTILQDADLLITAEGKIDEQTSGGKGPAGVAKRAKASNIPVVALGGNIPTNNISDLFDAVFPINPKISSLTDALQHSAENLSLISRQIGNLIALGQK